MESGVLDLGEHDRGQDSGPPLWDDLGKQHPADTAAPGIGSYRNVAEKQYPRTRVDLSQHAADDGFTVEDKDARTGVVGGRFPQLVPGHEFFWRKGRGQYLRIEACQVGLGDVVETHDLQFAGAVGSGRSRHGHTFHHRVPVVR